VSSLVDCAGAGGLGAGADAGQPVGGGQEGGAGVHIVPYVDSGAARDSHSRGNIAHWMTSALWTASVMPSRNDEEK
jgi:hypothetical protein